jgi:hypothetical protein
MEDGCTKERGERVATDTRGKLIERRRIKKVLYKMILLVETLKEQ